MVRTPCCEKIGLKKGPWTPEEDRILINYISLYGHGNWRALPKRAGLLRCGKSCRLRWTNYLRPDIKRGNFSKEEEETIIKLHESLGNRWSAIAAKLPGRTDNEIKNVWHSHLKKRVLKHNQSNTEIKRTGSSSSISDCNQDDKKEQNPEESTDQPKQENPYLRPSSPQQSNIVLPAVTNENNKIINTDSNNTINTCVQAESTESYMDTDEDFWSEVLSADISSFIADDFLRVTGSDTQVHLPLSPLSIMEPMQENSSTMSDDTRFWFELYTRAEELTDVPDFH